MFLFNYFKRREKGTERTIRITLSLISLAEELCVFSGTGAARPSIFTMFDITRVFIKVTLIKSRPRSLGRNNNFFPRLVSNRCYTGNRRKILRKKAGSAHTVHSSVRFRAKWSSQRKSMPLCLSRSTLSRLSLAVFPVCCENGLNQHAITISQRYARRQCAVRDTCNCNYTRLHCYKYSVRTQGIRNNDRFLSVADNWPQCGEKFMSRVTKFVISYR